ncbi:exodeoxyribonuclease VII large subunit [Lottiidibacillus patelloidae]|uniref:Exodeoxyribonuclease 7 large subunit n=1 Tax=Lottiidibacillus patelloidae TaxID=2670334 RepID=A0A263BWA7_9BACI|nr:exodeoxyribonuclease VII large subunit [Lottiidibacillus patelloidae]OZM57995.1 exodeoxyribonuclease VII large subunit [Lottiidibacillus patelloidae]
MSVTSLNRFIKRKFESDDLLQNVWIKGELSNFKRHSSGHMYFTLKDEKSRIQAVMFAGVNRYLKFQPESGMKVLIRGTIDVYEPNGQYQLYAKEMQPDGIGNLYLAYEELKKTLQAKGYFSPENKKPLPRFPQRIGIVTSPTGAAVRDIITTVRRRYPVVKTTIFPVLVQGPSAPNSIAKAIDKANEQNEVDLLIVGRGGGSIEELWAFNEKVVAESIFASQLPIISAVGHETDFTIADFVSDVRAPTPTAAAELAVPHIAELLERINQRKTRLNRAMNERYQGEKERLLHLQRSYAFRYPKKLVAQKEEQLDRLTESLHKESIRLFEKKREKLVYLQKNLQSQHPKEKLMKAFDTYKHTVTNLQKNMQSIHKDKTYLFKQKLSELNAYNPLAVMERGYSIVYSEQKELVKSMKQVQLGDKVNIQLKDGNLDCQVWGMEESDKNE